MTSLEAGHLSLSATLASLQAVLAGILALAVLAVLATATPAESRLGARYGWEGLQVTIEGHKATILYSGEMCTGFFEGNLEVSQQGGLIVGDGCEIELRLRADGGLDLQQGAGCTTYHGARCSLSGTVMPQD